MSELKKKNPWISLTFDLRLKTKEHMNLKIQMQKLFNGNLKKKKIDDRKINKSTRVADVQLQSQKMKRALRTFFEEIMTEIFAT